MDKKFVSRDKDGKELNLIFKKPSQKILNEADFLYRTHFSKCLRSGLVTNAEAFKIMKNTGLWTDADDEAATELRNQIREIEKLFQDAEKPLNKEEGDVKLKEVRQLRTDLADLNSRFNSVTDNTAETCATEVRLMYWAANCVYTEDGKRVFKDLDDLLTRNSETLAMDSFKEAMLVNMRAVFGIEISSNPLEDLPENKWLAQRKTAELQPV